MGNFFDKLFGKDNGSPDEHYPNRCRLFMVIDQATNTIMMVSKGRLSDPNGWGNPERIAELRVQQLLDKHHFIPDEYLFSWICDDIKKTPNVSPDGKEFAAFLRNKRAESKLSLREFAFRQEHKLKKGDPLPANDYAVWCGKQDLQQITEDYDTVIKVFKDKLIQLHFTKEEDVQQIGNILKRFGKHPKELNGIFEVWLETDLEIRMGWFKKLDRLIFSLEACKKQRLDDLRGLLRLRGDQIKPMHELVMQGYRQLLAERVGKSALLEQMKTADGKNYIEVRKWIYQYHKDTINSDEQDTEFEMDNQFVDLLKYVGDRLQQEEAQQKAAKPEPPRTQLMFGSTDGKVNTVIPVAAQPTIPATTPTPTATMEKKVEGEAAKIGSGEQAPGDRQASADQGTTDKPKDEKAPESGISEKSAVDPASTPVSTTQPAGEITPTVSSTAETAQVDKTPEPERAPEGTGAQPGVGADRDASAAGNKGSQDDTPEQGETTTDSAAIREALEALASGEPLSDEFLRWKDKPEVTAAQLAWVFEQPYISSETLISSGVFSAAIKPTRYFKQLESRLVEHPEKEDAFSDTDQQILSVYLESLNREQQYAMAYIQNHAQGTDEKLKSMRVRMLTRQTLLQDLEKIVMRWSDKRKEMHVAQSRDRLLAAFKAIAGGEMLDPDAGKLQTLESDLRMVDGNKPVLLVLTDALMELSQAKAAALLVKVLKSCVVRLKSYTNLDTMCLNNIDHSPMDLLYVALSMLDYQYETIPLYQKKIQRIRRDVISYFEERGYKVPAFISQDLTVAEIDLEMGEGIIGVYRQAYSYLHDVYREDVVAEYFDVESQVKAIREEAEAKRDAVKEKRPAKRHASKKKRTQNLQAQPTIDQLLNASLPVEVKTDDNKQLLGSMEQHAEMLPSVPETGVSVLDATVGGTVEPSDTDQDTVLPGTDVLNTDEKHEGADEQPLEDRQIGADESVVVRQHEPERETVVPNVPLHDESQTVETRTADSSHDIPQKGESLQSASEESDAQNDATDISEDSGSDTQEEDPMDQNISIDSSEPEFKPSEPMDKTDQSDDGTVSDEEAERMLEAASESNEPDDVPEGAEEESSADQQGESSDGTVQESSEEGTQEPADDDPMRPASLLERMEERYGVKAADADKMVGYDPIRDFSYRRPGASDWKWDLSHTKPKLGTEFLLLFNQINQSDNKEAKAFLCCCSMRMKDVASWKIKIKQAGRLESLVNFIRMKLVVLKNPLNEYDRAVIVHLIDIMNMLNS